MFNYLTINKNLPFIIFVDDSETNINAAKFPVRFGCQQRLPMPGHKYYPLFENLNELFQRFDKN